MPYVGREDKWLKMGLSRKQKEFNSYCYFDTEADTDGLGGLDGDQKLTIGHMIFANQNNELIFEDCFYNYNYFYDKLEEINEEHTDMVVHAFNLRYDSGIVALNDEFRLNRGWTLMKKPRVWDGGIVILKFFKGKPNTKSYRRITFIDCTNYFGIGQSLDSVLEAMGLPVKEKMPKGTPPTDPRWKPYVKGDAWGVKNIMEELRRVYWEEIIESPVKVKLPVSMASIAMDSWKYRAKEEQIYTQTNRQELDLEHKGAAGGRAEAFWVTPDDSKRIETKNYKVDCNAMYPSICMNPIPGGQPFYYQKETGIDMFAILDEMKEYGMACLLDCIMEIPVGVDDDFMWASREGIKKMIFPTGRFQAYPHQPEIDYALSKGYIKEIKTLIARPYTDPFSEFMQYHYDQRKKYKAEGNKAFATIHKNIGNSLTGKYNQRDYNWVDDHSSILIHGHAILCTEDGTTRQRVFMGRPETKVVGKYDVAHACPFVYGYITAMGRMMMFHLRKMVLEAGGRFFYQDTDSGIVDQTGYDAIQSVLDTSPNQDTLGLFKLEVEADIFGAHGPKDYSQDDKAKIKGIRKPEVGKRHYMQARFRNADIHWRKGEDGFINVKDIPKTVRAYSDKRTLIGEGPETEPRHFEEA